MRTKLTLKIATALLSVSTPILQLSTGYAQGTSFTYQGRLNDGANPANGAYDLRFAIYAASSGGSAVAGPLTNAAATVSNGLFTATLDFGTGVFTGANRWLEIGVRSNGVGSFVTLAPRTALTATPYALYAPQAGTATSATAVGPGGVATSSLQDNSVTSGKILEGTVTALDVNAGSFSNTFWKVDGNAGTTAGTHFLGTTDNQPVELRVNSERALRIEPTTASPNLLGGYAGNSVAPGLDAVVISGGGRAGAENRAAAELTFIGGGWANTNSGGGAFLGGGYLNHIESLAYDSVLTGGRENVIQSNAWRATIAGGLQNRVSGNSDYGVIGGGHKNTASSSGATVGGGRENTASSSGATIGGGQRNTANALYTTVAGGLTNAASQQYATVGGGRENTASAFYALVAGGRTNTAGGNYSTVAGGLANTAYFTAATVGGGERNLAGGNHETVAGGLANASTGDRSAIGGGAYNTNEARSATIAGGSNNLIAASSTYSAIAGGTLNSIETATESAFIGGGASNRIGTNSAGSLVGGGNNNTVGFSNRAAAIAGGAGNAIEPLNWYSVIGGGWSNAIRVEADLAVISGGYANKIAGNAEFSVIGGGQENLVQTNGSHVTIGGGWLNRAEDNSDLSVIGGGTFNVVESGAQFATISGGRQNRIETNSLYATVGGGYDNHILTSGSYAVIPGGYISRAAGLVSFAAGTRASADHDGAFVWADLQPAFSFHSTASNQFSVRASGGARFETSGAGLTVDGQAVLAGPDGSALTALNASQLTSGTVADARLSANVARLSATQTFTGTNAFLGQVGVGTTTPGSALTVATGIGYGIEHTDGSRRLSTYLDGGGGWIGTVSSDPLNFFVANGGSSMTLDTSARVGIGRTPTANKLEVEGEASKAAAGSWLANSDARIKQDLRPVTDALATLEKVRLVSFRYTDEYRAAHSGIEDRRYLNVVAQEFRAVFPEHVKSSGEKLADGSEILQVDTYPLTIYAAAAVTELNQQLQRKEKEISELQHRLAALEGIVARLNAKGD